MQLSRLVVVALGLSLTAGAARGQTQPASRPTTTSSAADVAVYVNGHAILESEVDALVKSRTPREVLENPSHVEALKSYRAQKVLGLIADYLVNEAVEKAGIVVTDEEMAAEMNAELDTYLSNNGLTREEFEDQLLSERGMYIRDFLAQRVADPKMRQMVRQTRLVERRYPDRLKVSADEVRQYYSENANERYRRPEMVKASHILISTQGLNTEQKAEARQKAEQVLALARQPGADFAALAREHSACPSKLRGGNLGFFRAQGQMEAEFSAAAFALRVGEISGVVETKAGYHIIKVTDRREAGPIPFDVAEAGVRYLVRSKKLREARSVLLEELRASARIEYPPGKEPPPEPPPGAVEGP